MGLSRLLRTTVVLGVARGSARQEATPVSKVSELLKRLQTQLESESKEEAKAYDEYACFCKEQLDDKHYAIETSTAKIDKRKAQIESLSADLAQIVSEISKVGTSLAELQSEIDSEQDARTKEHKAYLAKAKDHSSAMDSLQRAIDAMEDSKKDIADSSDAVDLDLLQVRALSRLAATSLSEGRRARAAVSLRRLAQQPAALAYGSNDVIGTLKGLHNTFSENKNELDKAEFENRAASEKRSLNLVNTKKFKEKDRAKLEMVSGKKTEQKETLEKDLSEELADRKADQSFLEVLVAECEKKAGLFDARSAARADELAAIAKALEVLESGVKPNYDADTKLVGAQLRSRGALPRAASFLQLRGSRAAAARRGAEAAAARALQALSGAARDLKSQLLTVAVARIAASEDHFVKVRGLIKDLVAKLEADAQEEASQKAFCDKAMSEGLEQRDEAAASIEGLRAESTAKAAEKAEAKVDIKELSQEIAENQKALLEAAEVRQKEKEENAAAIKSASEGRDAVKLALSVLASFYDSHATLVQVSYTPPDSDRDGKTVGDLAPKSFDGNYAGNQQQSKGIIGLLEVIQADFERTLAKTADQEREEAGEFEAFSRDSEANIRMKEDAVEQKGQEVIALRSALVDMSGDLDLQSSRHQSASQTLEELKAECVDGEETHEERVAKRKKEIEALKEAHDILEQLQS